jgi:hypothetical protein
MVRVSEEPTVSRKAKVRKRRKGWAARQKAAKNGSVGRLSYGWHPTAGPK